MVFVRKSKLEDSLKKANVDSQRKQLQQSH